MSRYQACCARQSLKISLVFKRTCEVIGRKSGRTIPESRIEVLQLFPFLHGYKRDGQNVYQIAISSNIEGGGVENKLNV